MASEPVTRQADRPEEVLAGPPLETGAHVPRHLGLALVVIATAQLMIVLDATIVNVALPHIQRALGFSGSGLEWVVTAYSLAFGSLLLLGGRLGDLFGRRRIFMTGIAVFSIGSLRAASPPRSGGCWPPACCRAAAGRWRRRPPWRSSPRPSRWDRHATGPWACTRA